MTGNLGAAPPLPEYEDPLVALRATPFGGVVGDCGDKALSCHLIAAQESERRRIAHELHDGLGQILAAAKYRLEALLTQPAAIPVRGEVGGIIEHVQGAVEELRRVSIDLHPAMLEDLGLVATLARFHREYAGTYPHLNVGQNISVTEAAIAPALKLALYRIVQEACNNAAQHAKAHHVFITLGRGTTGGIRLSVADDGGGIPERSFHTGLGLSGMCLRAESTGGTLTILSRPGEGTEVIAEWPF